MASSPVRMVFFHVGNFIGKGHFCVPFPKDFLSAILRPGNDSLRCPGVLEDLDVSPVVGEGRPLGLFGVKGEGNARHLLLRIHQQDGGLFIYASGGKADLGGYLIRCLREEPTGQGEGVDADIQQRAGKWAYGKWSWPPPALHDVPGPVPPLLRVPRNLG